MVYNVFSSTFMNFQRHFRSSPILTSATQIWMLLRCFGLQMFAINHCTVNMFEEPVVDTMC